MTPKLAKILFMVFLVIGTLIPIVYTIRQKQEAAQSRLINNVPDLAVPSPSPTPLLQFSINRGRGGFGDDD